MIVDQINITLMTLFMPCLFADEASKVRRKLRQLKQLKFECFETSGKQTKT